MLEDYKVPQGEQVIDPRAAYMISNILSDPAAKLFTYGPNTPLMLHQNDCFQITSFGASIAAIRQSRAERSLIVKLAGSVTDEGSCGGARVFQQFGS